MKDRCILTLLIAACSLLFELVMKDKS